MTNYKFEIYYNKKTGAGVGIRFKDGSRIVLDRKRKSLRFALPRKKFDKVLRELKKDEIADDKWLDNKRLEAIRITLRECGKTMENRK